MKQFKHTGIYLLLAILLSPGLLKMFHTHEHHVHEATTGQNLPQFNEQCQICEFEFSVYHGKAKIQTQQKFHFKEITTHCHFESIVLIRHPYIFSLRAPPAA